MTSPTDLEAAAAIRAHHAELHATLRTRVLGLVDAAAAGGDFGTARAAVLEFLDDELLPHAAAEERTLYRAAEAGSSALLVEAMRAEHVDLAARVEALRDADLRLATATAASVVLALFESHLRKENELLIPALLARADVSLADLLAGMHQLVG